jgi:hypothetical protein
MKRLAMALTLMCVLSSPIFAGNMPTGGFVDPPPPPATQLSDTQSDTTQSSETIDIQSSETEPNLFATVLLTIVSLI